MADATSLGPYALIACDCRAPFLSVLTGNSGKVILCLIVTYVMYIPMSDFITSARREFGSSVTPWLNLAVILLLVAHLVLRVEILREAKAAIVRSQEVESLVARWTNWLAERAPVWEAKSHQIHP